MRDEVEDENRRYLELGIFAGDANIDLGLPALLWRRTCGLSLQRGSQLIAKLRMQGLIGKVRPEQGVMRLSTMIRSRLENGLGEARRETHRALVDAVAEQYGLPAANTQARASMRSVAKR